MWPLDLPGVTARRRYQGPGNYSNIKRLVMKKIKYQYLGDRIVSVKVCPPCDNKNVSEIWFEPKFYDLTDKKILERLKKTLKN